MCGQGSQCWSETEKDMVFLSSCSAFSSSHDIVYAHEEKYVDFLFKFYLLQICIAIKTKLRYFSQIEPDSNSTSATGQVQ